MDYSLISNSPLCCDRNGTVCVTVVNATLAIYGKPELNVKQLMLLGRLYLSENKHRGKQIMYLKTK